MKRATSRGRGYTVLRNASSISGGLVARYGCFLFKLLPVGFQGAYSSRDDLKLLGYSPIGLLYIFHSIDLSRRQLKTLQISYINDFIITEFDRTSVSKYRELRTVYIQGYMHISSPGHKRGILVPTLA